MLVPTTNAGYKLFMEGQVALAEVENCGMKIDVEYLDRKIKETDKQIRELSEGLRKDKDCRKVFKAWKQRYGAKTNLGSRDQLGTILFDVLKIEGGKETDSGRFKTDKDALEDIDIPFVKKFLLVEKLKKANTTYLKGILRETDGNGFLHPSFNLNLVSTFRSCVAKGTLIEVVRDVSKYPKGIPIECVKPGDYVYCYDKNCKLTLRKVTWAGKTGHKKVIRVHWVARGKHGHLDVTPEHKIRLIDGSYVRADELQGSDFRKKDSSKHAPKIRVLSLGRCDDRLYPTGLQDILDHRFVYSHLVGKISNEDVIHHKDRNHLNNKPTNLEKKTRSEHSFLHVSTSLTKESRRKGTYAVIEKRRKDGTLCRYFEENPNWISISKFQFLRMIAKAQGHPTRLPHDFEVMKRKAVRLGIDLKTIWYRYDAKGKYISRGRLLRASLKSMTEARLDIPVNFYKLKRLYAERNITPIRIWKNQFGTFIPNNHKITRIEKIHKVIDVYDLEIEGCHNFIANEICVHNSSDSPNVQNLPIRDDEMSEIIRPAFIPRSSNRRFVERDFSGIEVRVSACYNKDPVLLNYIKNPESDMHRDLCCRVYLLKKKQVTKDARYCAKNKATFPFFYGSWYFDCAQNLWIAIDRMNLQTADGTPMRTHLKSKGIKELGVLDPKIDPKPGTFLHHMKKVEHWFWKEQFKVYDQWKWDVWNKYCEVGYIDTLTGFRCSAPMDRKQSTNFGIQGSAFHCLLWSLIQVQKKLKKYHMKSVVIGQIHDSLLADVPDKEMKDYAEITHEVMSVELPKHWKWIIVPLESELEASPPGHSWYEKQKFEA